MSRLVDRALIDAEFATAAVYRTEIHSLLADLRILAPDLALLADTRQRGQGFLTAEGRDALDRMTTIERTERRSQPLRRDDTGQPIIGLKWLNRTSIAAGTGEIPAPGNFRGIATEADLAFALLGHIHRIRRVLLASGHPDPEPELLAGARTAVAAAARPAGFIGPMPAVTTIVPADATDEIPQLLDRLDRLVDAAPSVTLLAPIQRDLEQLADQVSVVVDGNDRSHRPDPCPHCGNHTLIRYEATRRRPQPFIRCERDPRWTSKHFRPCVCPAAICQCKTNPVTYRHEWFDNPKDKTQRPVWDLIDRIKLIKENTVLETKAQDAARRVRDLHQRTVIYQWAENCPGEHFEPDEAEAAERGVEQQLVIHQHIDDPQGSGGEVCVTCEPAVIACTHCTHDTDQVFTAWPCDTIRALDDDPKDS
ncbi:hypothetical protein [Nocardioides sp.]|uniref:hypothetical protein n=1 Tax=Nocardioides sp. TaxID=35761 RepID=UPI00260436B3|nr:hypothetical protein [Nocardioides sp.]MDI6911458.1 hypothetical protein [Nocardioides sp.]